MRAWAKLSFSIAAASPMRSCIPPEARRIRWPIRCTGIPASGYSTAAIRLSFQSMVIIVITRPTSVAASATAFTARVIASRTTVASVVKRAASVAGASRSTRASAAFDRCPNIATCSRRITRSTMSCVSTDWKYIEMPLIAVTISTSTGTWYRMRGSRRENMVNAQSISAGYSAVVPDITSVISTISTIRPRKCWICSRHSRRIRAAVLCAGAAWFMAVPYR